MKKSDFIDWAVMVLFVCELIILTYLSYVL